MLDLTIAVARLAPVAPPVRALLAHLAEDRDALEKHLGALVGSRQLEDVLGPQALEEVARAADEPARPPVAASAAVR